MSEENEKLKRRLVEQLKNEAEKSSTICPTENSSKSPIESSESLADGSTENTTKCSTECLTKCSTESSTKSPTESPTEKLKIEMRYLVNEVIDEEPGSNKKIFNFLQTT